MFRLVVGLGNPGSKYQQTRHNIAWLLFDQLDELKSSPWKSKFKGEFAEISVRGEKVIFLKPQTYMNLSGESVRPLMDFYKITSKEILVVHDELDLDLGVVHFKQGGGLAGNNGLKSIAAHLGTQDFARLRIGIGRPEYGNVSDWVLSGFHGDDGIKLEQLMGKVPMALNDCLKDGLTSASQKWNKKKIID